MAKIILWYRKVYRAYHCENCCKLLPKAIFLILLLLSFPLFCLAQYATTATKPQQSLQLSIKSDKELYRLGEDKVSINAEIKSQSAENIYLYGYLSFSVVNNTTKQDVSLMMKDILDENQALWFKQILAPSKSVNKVIKFIPRNNLPKGKYAITFSFNSVVSKKHNVISNAITVEMTGAL